VGLGPLRFPRRHRPPACSAPFRPFAGGTGSLYLAGIAHEFRLAYQPPKLGVARSNRARVTICFRALGGPHPSAPTLSFTEPHRTSSTCGTVAGVVGRRPVLRVRLLTGALGSQHLSFPPPPLYHSEPCVVDGIRGGPSLSRWRRTTARGQVRPDDRRMK